MAIAIDFDRRMGIVYGSAYCGSVKKLMFSVMNYLLPAVGVLPLHCSANEGKKGDAALLLGLSGTGKTTLSADPRRALLGDDEHGWSDDGVWNFENGCYAKLINLDPKKEPEIYNAVMHDDDWRRHGAIVENAMVYPDGTFDLDDERLTPNSRASFPLSYLGNVKPSARAGHPEDDPLPHGRRPRRPPSDRPALQGAGDALVPHGLHEQARRDGDGDHRAEDHLLPLLRRAVHAAEPGRLRADARGEARPARDEGLPREHRLERRTRTESGKRIDITVTRTMVQAALEGEFERAASREDPFFRVLVPERVEGVPAEILSPKETWTDKKAYDERARKLACEFGAHFEKAYGKKGIAAAVAAECPGR